MNVILFLISFLVLKVIPKAVGRYLFDRIRDLKTVEQFLEATYSRKEALTQELVSPCPRIQYTLCVFCLRMSCDSYFSPRSNYGWSIDQSISKSVYQSSLN